MILHSPSLLRFPVGANLVFARVSAQRKRVNTRFALTEIENAIAFRRTRHAFTLVELLVVIGVITVLIAMLLPALRRAQEQVRQVDCMSKMRQLGIAYHMYANEYKGYLPKPGDFIPFGSKPGAPFDDPRWCPFYTRYLNGKTQAGSGIGFATGNALSDGVYHCRSGPTQFIHPFFDNVISYSQNGWIDYRNNPATPGFNWTGGPIKRGRLSGWRYHWAVGVLVETNNVYDNAWFAPYGAGLPFIITARHNRGGNVLFLDGHVEFLTRKEWGIRYNQITNGKASVN